MAIPYTFANATLVLPLNQLDANFAYLEALISGGIGSDFMEKTANLSDVASVATARTNLGLGTGDTPEFNGINATGEITMDNDVSIRAKSTGGVSTPILQKYTNNYVYLDNYDGNIIIRPTTSSGGAFDLEYAGGAIKATLSGVRSRFILWNGTASSKWEIINGVTSDTDGTLSIYDRTNARRVWSWDQNMYSTCHGNGYAGLVMASRGDAATRSTALYFTTSTVGNYMLRGDTGRLDVHYGAVPGTTTGTLGVSFDTDGTVIFYKGAFSKGGEGGHHVEAYGATGDGTTNDRAAIQAAIDAAAAGTNGSNTVRLGAKTYKIDTELQITLNAQAVNIVGEGSQVSIIKVASGVDGMVFDSAGAYGTAASINTVNLADFQILSMGGSATGLTLGTSGAFLLDSYNGSTVKNVLVREFTTGIYLLNARNFRFDNVVSRFDNLNGAAVTTDTTGLFITCDNSASFCGDHTFASCEFICYGLSTGTASTSVYVYNNGAAALVSGLKFQQCNMYYGSLATIYIYNTNTGNITTVMFDQCQVDQGVATNNPIGIKILNDDATGYIEDIRIDNNWVLGMLQGMYITATAGEIRHVNISNSFFYDHLDDAIYMNGVYGAIIANNNFKHVGDTGASQVIYMGAATAQYTITGNVHRAEPTLASNVNYFATLSLGGNYAVVKDNVCQVKGGPTAINDLLGGVTKAVSDNLAYN
jgi:hypothetical protein